MKLYKKLVTIYSDTPEHLAAAIDELVDVARECEGIVAVDAFGPVKTYDTRLEASAIKALEAVFTEKQELGKGKETGRRQTAEHSAVPANDRT